ncbi:MAG: DUF6268 family outer membrane beta-barrel protein [Flavobacterium sp.]|nr:DUF6268 family outer membrane beta-barrel protein [Flavobacterium sp.]
MKKVIFVKLLCMLFFSSVNAQIDFSTYTVITGQTTNAIKVNEALLGSSFKKELNSKYSFAADVKYGYKNLAYSDGAFSGYFLNEFEKLESILDFTYSEHKKRRYHFNLQPFIANENQLKLSSLYVLYAFKTDFIINQKNALTIGAAKSSIFGKPSLIPIISYEYKYSDRLNLSIGFPETKFKYANNSRNNFVLKNDFNGSFYALDTTSKLLFDTSSKASFSQMTTSFEYERNLDANWFLNFKAGYDFNRKYLLLDNNYHTTFNFDMEDGFNLGLKIKYKY